MLVVGLTGNIASGKSTVARLLVERGAQLIDSDVLARRAVEPGTPALERIVKRWGPGVQRADGTLDRAALRRIVFSDPAELRALDAIVHPEVERLRQRDLSEARAAGVGGTVCDIPLLFEAGLESSVDCIVLVDAPAHVRLDRLVNLRRISPDEAQAMMDAQLPAESKRKRAHFVVENDGSLESLRERTHALWDSLTRQASAFTRASV